MFIENKRNKLVFSARFSDNNKRILKYLAYTAASGELTQNTYTTATYNKHRATRRQTSIKSRRKNSEIEKQENAE